MKGLVNQRVFLQCEHPIADDRIVLRSNVSEQLRLSDPERCILAEIGKRFAEPSAVANCPGGVRMRLSANGPEAAELAGRLDDESIRVAADGVRRLYRVWSALPAGGTLRLTWPLHESWLRLI